MRTIHIICFLIVDFSLTIVQAAESIAERPNIERLMAHGLRFTNAQCHSALCSPWRASIFTGWYSSHATGFLAVKKQDALNKMDWYEMSAMQGAKT